MTTIAGVVLDIGETIRDDTNEMHSWADWLDVPRHTLSALIGATRATGGTTDDAFRLLDPTWDLDRERKRRAAAGIDECMGEADLYSDVRSALHDLRAMGLWTAVAGNQSSRVGELLRALALPVDDVIVSGDLGIAKPSPAFFAAIVRRTPFRPIELIHVGDNWTNDVVAPARCGLRTAFLRRGPWGHLDSQQPDLDGSPDLRIDSLAVLPDRIAALRAVASR